LESFMGLIYAAGFSWAPDGFMSCNGQQLSIQQYQALYSLLVVQFGGDGRTFFNLPDLRGRMMVGQGSGPGLTPRSVGQNGGLEQNAVPVPYHTHVAAFQGAPSPVTGAGGGPLSATASTTLNIPIVPGAAGSSAASTAIANNSMALGGARLTANPSGATGITGPYTPASTVGATTAKLFGTADTTVTLSGGGAGDGGTVIPQGAVTVQPTGNTTPIQIMNPFLVLNFIICVDGLYPARP
jgi:microcystin-dependent protein